MKSWYRSKWKNLKRVYAYNLDEIRKLVDKLSQAREADLQQEYIKHQELFQNMNQNNDNNGSDINAKYEKKLNRQYFSQLSEVGKGEKNDNIKQVNNILKVKMK